MKKIILAFVVYCTFSGYGIAMNSDAKLNDIEMIEKKISVFKAERANIRNRQLLIHDEGGIYRKKMKELENETKIPEKPIKIFPSAFSKKVLAKTENDIKMLALIVAAQKLEIDFNKINVKIDKANIELIKAEIKAGKTPKIPLKLAKAVLKLTKSSLKNIESGSKQLQARLKENEAKIEYLEAAIKTREEREKSTTNDSYIKGIELAELELIEIMARLKFEKVRGETTQARIKDVESCAKHYWKPAAELRKIYLKFDKAVDKKKFISFLKHD